MVDSSIISLSRVFRGRNRIERKDSKVICKFVETEAFVELLGGWEYAQETDGESGLDLERQTKELLRIRLTIVSPGK